MKIITRLFVALLCIGLIVIAWFTTFTSKSDSEKQLNLIYKADDYMADKIYVTSIPLLEEAISYNGKHNAEAEQRLKTCYINLIEQRKYKNRYQDLLDAQMARDDASVDVFIEAANYYLADDKYNKAMEVFRDGIKKTEDNSLKELYENNRYEYILSFDKYQDMTAIYKGSLGVMLHDYWGVALSNGELILPCEYTQISTYDDDRTVVLKDNEVYAVDDNNNRTALLKEKALNFGNLSSNRIPIQTSEGWKNATADLEVGSTLYEDMGMYSDGYISVKENGRWRLVDSKGEYLLDDSFDDIITDELGRAYYKNAVFVKTGDKVTLLVDKEPVGDTYDDARPFSDGDLAAVKKGDKWGYIDINGELIIDYQYDDALSFGNHLGAVKINGLWGYITDYNKMAINAEFTQAKSFDRGHAPVLTPEGWKILTLREYRDGGLN